MKLTSVIFLVAVLQTWAAVSYSQTTTLSINLKNASVQTVLQQVEDQSEFYFLYSRSVIDVDRTVDVQLKNARINEVLNTLFTGSDVAYKVEGRQIVLSRKSENSVLETQQGKSVSGKVTDSSGSPLPGVSVVVKGTTNGTITDANGNYSLPNVPENATMQFSFVGMKSQEIAAAGKTSINVTLAEETVGIDEVVAIGYGTQKKATVTGSIATIKGEELAKNPSSNFVATLQGQMPGLTVNTRNGDPGNEGIQILVRGKSTLGSTGVLVVIDGVAGGDISILNPADIESISVLKDASAAIYGARAANGVILVTTKRGKIGKPQLNYSANFGATQPTRMQNLMDSWEYAVAENEFLKNNGQTAKWSDQDITLFKNGTDPLFHPNVDWYDVSFRKWTPQKQHNLTLSGGTESIKYFLSGQIVDQDRMFKENDGKGLDRYQLRANIDAQVTKILKVGIDMNYSKEIVENAYQGNYRNWWDITRMMPNAVAFWPNGLPGPTQFGYNPAIEGSSEKFGYNRENTFNYGTKLSFDL